MAEGSGGRLQRIARLQLHLRVPIRQLLLARRGGLLQVGDRGRSHHRQRLLARQGRRKNMGTWVDVFCDTKGTASNRPYCWPCYVGALLGVLVGHIHVSRNDVKRRWAHPKKQPPSQKAVMQNTNWIDLSLSIFEGPAMWLAAFWG